MNTWVDNKQAKSNQPIVGEEWVVCSPEGRVWRGTVISIAKKTFRIKANGKKWKGTFYIPTYWGADGYGNGCTARKPRCGE